MGKHAGAAVAGPYPYSLSRYAKHITPTVDHLANCRLPNHYHLLVREKEDDVIVEKRPESVRSAQSAPGAAWV